MPAPPAALYTLAQFALGTTQSGLGQMLGVSRRTAQRWASQGIPVIEMPRLARLVYPKDAELAAQIATAASTSLEALGLVLPRPPAPPPAPALPPPPPPLPPPPPPDGVVDAITCAAAEAMEMMPRDVRLGLLAAFARADELGVDSRMVVRVLRGQVQPASAPALPSPTDGASPSRRKTAR